MDANGLKFWMASEARDWALDDAAAWDAARRVVRLASRRRLPSSEQDKDTARTAANRVRATLDAYGTWAMVSEDARTVMAAGAFPQPVELCRVGENERILDLAVGGEGILYLAVEEVSGPHHVLMVDLLQRWSPVKVFRPDVHVERILARPSKGAWLVDRKNKKVARLTGMPFPEHMTRNFSPLVGRPCQENPRPPQILDPVTLPISAPWELVAAASSAAGLFAFLFWVEGAEARVLVWDEINFFPLDILRGLSAPFSIGWVGEDRWALLTQGAREAPVYQLPTGMGKEADPVGSIYPLADWDGSPFLNTLTSPVHYLAAQAPDATKAEASVRPKPLLRLSHAFLTTHAEVRAARVFDSGNSRTVWHRIYLEAALPSGTGVRVRLAAGDDPEALQRDHGVPIHFGTVPADANPVEAWTIPRGSWIPLASEIPFHQGFLDCPRHRDRAGLFTALIQKPSGRVRRLQGRFLSVTMDLWGTGQASPEVAALRVYAPRFSYRDRYLPEIYHETLAGSEADVEGASTGADFLERFLSLFEGLLTPLEDTVAAAHVLTDPEATPAHALEWLASWIGITLEPAFSESAKRRLLREAMRLFQEHGTPAGMARALDIATEGAVEQGRLVVVEDFKVRRTFSTILGADLADASDPLTLSISSEGNSRVGEALVLGSEAQREFLALFRPEVSKGEEEAALVSAFFDRFAHRVTILVHKETDQETVRLVRRVAALEAPAHVDVRVAAASENLVLGITSLLGVDTAPQGPLPLRSVRENASHLGKDSSLVDIPSLDSRLD